MESVRFEATGRDESDTGWRGVALAGSEQFDREWEHSDLEGM